MKRQRWLARQRGGDAGAGHGPPHLQMGDIMAPGGEPHAPKSPLSRLVAEGYPETSSHPSSAQRLYGERPMSDPFPVAQSGKPGSRGSYGTSNGGFDARIAGQWSDNVQRDVHQRQSRHDPGVAGPPMPHGGHRITQAPGGGASIDLSWGSTQAAHPPRMPGATPSYAPNGQAGHYAGMAAPQYADGVRPNRVSPSYAARGSGGGGAPWGREGDVRDMQQATPMRRDACPFGVDVGMAPAPGAGVRGSSRGRGRSPSPHHGMLGAGGVSKAMADVPAAGYAARGRAAGRPPGGASSFVFG